MSPFLLVARPVNKNEVRKSDKATAAMRKEWDKLRSAPRPGGIGAWGESKVREAEDVRKEARKANESIHMCDVFGICVEKGSELSEGHPDRTFKGRVCLSGNIAKYGE